jgi:methionine synthase II (cobalamin-independent)
VAARGTAKTLGLGLLDGRNTRLDDVAAAARLIERIAKAANPGSAHLTTSCGLEYLPRDRARLKLGRLAEMRAAFLGSAA